MFSKVELRLQAKVIKMKKNITTSAQFIDIDDISILFGL
jgi:hypothetical protein